MEGYFIPASLDQQATCLSITSNEGSNHTLMGFGGSRCKFPIGTCEGHLSTMFAWSNKECCNVVVKCRTQRGCVGSKQKEQLGEEQPKSEKHRGTPYLATIRRWLSPQASHPPQTVSSVMSGVHAQSPCLGGVLSAASSRTRDPYFEILGSPRGIMASFLGQGIARRSTFGSRHGKA